MDQIISYLDMELMGIKVSTYTVVLVLIFSGFLSKTLSQYFFTKLHRVAKKTRFRLDDIVIDAVSKPVSWLFLLFFLYLASLYLPVIEKPVNLRFFIDALFKGFIVIDVVWMLLRLLKELTDLWSRIAKETEGRIDDQLVPLVRSTGKVFIISFGAVLFLQNLGYSVGSLLAGLGIGGAALAFASKDALANLFGSLVVFVDRPFKQGDYVSVHSIEGTIEEIGVRSTKVRTLANSIVSIPNSDFTTQPIINWSKRDKRQISFDVGVTYSSTPENIKELVAKLKKTIKDDPDLHDDCIVSLNNFGSSSIDIMVNCYTKTVAWEEYHEAKEKFMLNVMQDVASLGLDFAFPTKTIHIESNECSE